ncbi:MAG TPA: hypothetical protein VN767_08085 [Streptosporangiaceae bacterium]|nr:hypothetical protein [Streptosporangiaceae bacterium]
MTEQDKTANAPMPLSRAWKIISRAASMLDAARQHGLYSDISPSDLELDQPDDRRYLSGFVRDRITIAQVPVDGPADQYALACFAFELLTGMAPFEQPSGLGLPVTQLPAAVDPVLARALAKDPADRYPTCTEFADDLGRALGLFPEKATQPTGLESIGTGASWPSVPVPSGAEPSDTGEQPVVWGSAVGADYSPSWIGQPGNPNSGLPGHGTESSSRPRPGWRSRRAVKTAGPEDPVSRAVREAVRPGLLAFNPPSQMNQGRSERVEVGIARSAALRDELTAGFRGRGIAETFPVPASPAMGVELHGGSFEIDALSPAEQLIVPLARWEFDVTPVRSGSQTLTLCVSLRIDSPLATGGRIAVPVLERQIQIKVNVRYGVQRFTANNWQWVAGTVIGLGGGIAAWIELVR